MDLKSLQKPLKDRYRTDPQSSRITLRARGSGTGAPIACSVDIGRAAYQAQAHAGVGGEGTAGCSGDLQIPTEGITVVVEGDMDLSGTLGLSREVPVGFQDIRVRFDIDAPEATTEQLTALRAKTEQYCVVLQTLTRPPAIQVDWGEAANR